MEPLMTPNRILVIDDEPQITRVLRAALAAQRFDVRTANDPEEGLRIFSEWQPDLVVTDLMMPEMSGVELCRAIRSNYETPVIVLSVREHEQSKIEALDAGADDYVTKPFSIQELLARVRAHLRRAPERITAAVEAGDFLIDPDAHTVMLNGKPIHLTPTEFDLLLFLHTHPGTVFSREQLMQQVWGPNHFGTVRTVDNFIARLRAKIEDDPDDPRHIETVRGIGYRFNP